MQPAGQQYGEVPGAVQLIGAYAADGTFKTVAQTRRDISRIAKLVVQYADLPLGTTDAAGIALAERLDVDEVATIDRRTPLRPRHVKGSRSYPSSRCRPHDRRPR